MIFRRLLADWKMTRSFMKQPDVTLCGNCFECDGCFGVCPEGAIIKLGKGNRYKIDLQLKPAVLSVLISALVMQ